LTKNSQKIQIPVRSGDVSSAQVSDQQKRTFLKAVGGVGLGAFLLSMLPTSKADALVLGGTPSTSVVGLKDSTNNRINPATEDTLSAAKTDLDNIKTNTDKFQFDGSNNLKVVTSGTSGGGVDPVGLKDVSATPINPATDESLIYLRRMVKLMESQATVDAANRQRVAVESAVISSGTVTTVTTVGSVTNIGSWDARQMYADQAKNVYSNSIRRNLTFD
jgi:hypothetical protein